MALQKVTLSFVDPAREDFKGTLRSFMTPPDIVAFERRFGVPAGKFQGMPDEEKKVEWILFFVWRAYCREHRADVEEAWSDFDPFVEALSDVEAPEDDDEEAAALAVDPTEAPTSS